MLDKAAMLAPLILKETLSHLERFIRCIAEEAVLTVAKARPAKLNGQPGVLKLGGGLWHKIVFVPDDGRFLGRCFLDHVSREEAEKEFEWLLANELKP